MSTDYTTAGLYFNPSGTVGAGAGIHKDLSLAPFFFVSPFFNVTLLKNLMLERGKQWRCKAHLLIRWGSSSDDMTITGIGLRGFSACQVWFAACESETDMKCRNGADAYTGRNAEMQ